MFLELSSGVFNHTGMYLLLTFAYRPRASGICVSSDLEFMQYVSIGAFNVILNNRPTVLHFFVLSIAECARLDRLDLCIGSDIVIVIIGEKETYCETEDVDMNLGVKYRERSMQIKYLCSYKICE